MYEVTSMILALIRLCITVRNEYMTSAFVLLEATRGVLYEQRVAYLLLQHRSRGLDGNEIRK